MTERYVVTSAAGEPVIRTNDRAAAERHLRTLRGEVLDGRTVRLVLEAVVVALHDFGQTGAPITGYRAQIQGEHITPRYIAPRRDTAAEAEKDLYDLIRVTS